MKMLGRLLGNALGLFVTTLVPGIHFHGSPFTLLLAGALLGVFNFFVRPVALVLSCPLMLLTLGLFYFVLNGILLWLASFLLPRYSVDGIVPGILGALLMSVVNWALAAAFGDSKKKD
ncbi:MAG TPA: phage holin family protein [Vicinamibacteria bacterium]|nr:phage holin family protein [Vicinamibacteria bacterium]